MKIILRCKVCNKRIETDESMEGEFLSEEDIWSDLLEKSVVFKGIVTCKNCILTACLRS